MNEVLLANLFFIITGSAVLVVAGFACFLCYHLAKLVKMGRAILAHIETSTAPLIDDIKTLHDYVANGNIFGKILMMVVAALTHTSSRDTSHRTKKKVTSEE